MPLAKPNRAVRRAPHARDRVIKVKSDIFHSTAIICEFLYYAFNAILGIRSIYPPEDFKWQQRYDIHLPMLVDPDLKNYIRQTTTQLKPWLEKRKVSRVVLAIVAKDSQQTVERWQFDLQIVNESGSTIIATQVEPELPQHEPLTPAELARSDRDMQAEALQILRQIFSSVTFMPELRPDECSFTILSYVDKKEVIPEHWSRSDPHMISTSACQVPIHGLTTSVYRLTPKSTYVLNGDEGDEE
ncbi:hypothetical protein CROQUDRAFT_654354 [Cronartium quercuum f. sp. fusiforme G11]|uniref:HORMA domain-containing protein n=1 Tax=Cronartium quercuum f. sp. fusiforme G11 TaxID=708437 RepID=A0A9P6NKN2_9BASI|nr:hypothetical protein CROQUDRAFT_654354 [Cronartium quercuum f. sp. fusiforme G11]